MTVRRLRLSRLAPVVALLALGALPFAARLPVDNRIEQWVDPSGPVAADYERFRASFGSDEFVLVAYTGRDVFDAAALEAQEGALEALEEAPHVVKVTGVPSLRDALFVGRSLEEFRAEMRATPFYEHFLLGADDTSAGLFIETSLPPRPRARRELLDGIRHAVAPLEEAGFAIHVVGPPALNVALDEISAREAARSFPIAFALSLAVLWGLFRCWRATLVACLCAGASIVLTLGLMGALGSPLTMVSAVLPSLLWVLGLAGAIHLLQRYRVHRARTPSAEDAAGRALSEVARPCGLAAITTAFGFGSLLVAGMEPIRALGVFAAAGLLISLGVNLVLGPWLIVRLAVPGVLAPSEGSPRFARIARLATRRSGGVIGFSLVAVMAAGAACLALRVEADPLAFLPADSATVRAYQIVAERLTGFYALEVVVETPSGWLDPALWPAVDRVSETLAAAPGVARVLSPLDLLRQLHHWRGGRTRKAWRLPDDAARARSLVEEYDPFGGGARSGLVARDGRSLRLSALVRVMPSSQFLAIREAAEGALAGLPAPLSGYATGIVAKLVDAQLGLVRSQLRSFGLAFATVFLCLWVGLRSARLTALAVLPNLLPILSALAAMALLRVPLDAATVMVASVALGIAVDDTVHVLAAVARERSRGRPVEMATERALAAVGPALVITTATAGIGFLALLSSAFVPIRLFGGLSALALGVALAADVLLLPALIARAPWKELPVSALDARVAEVVDLHFDPRWGAPFWLERARRLGFDPRRAIRGLADLARLGPFPLQELATAPVQALVPRRFHGLLDRFVTAETGGTTGAPRRTAYLREEFEAAFVTPFVEAARLCGFPRDAHWLYIGPSGPHPIGKAARACAAAMGSIDPWSVDLDPRWVRRLPAASLGRRRYLEHVLAQAEGVLASQEVGVLFATPPVLEALGERLPERVREAVQGVHLGGMAAGPGFWRRLRGEWFPRARVMGGYGNSLAGLCPQIGFDPERAPEYFPHGRRLVVEVDAPRAEDARGRVRFHRLDDSAFLPNVLERDEASVADAPADALARGFRAGGLRDPRPPADAPSGERGGLY